jgi:MFS family permease
MARVRVLADVTPLRQSAAFRRLFVGQLVSFLGTQVTIVAVAIHVYRLTESSFAVGMVSLVQLPPLLLGSLIGGAIADSTDRRRLLAIMQILLGVCGAGLAVNAMLPTPALWPLYAFTAIAAAFSGVDRPARSAVIPAVVGRSQVPAAFALWQIHLTLGLALGPAVGGLLVGRFGLATAYWVDVATFGLALVAVLGLPPLPPEGGGTPVTRSSILDGVRFVRTNQALQGTFVIDINAMVLGMPRALFPALGATVFGGGAQTVGLLFAAPGVGALLGAVTSGWVGEIRRQGLAVLVAVAVWGAAIALFGVTSWLPLALVLLGVAGAADVVSAVFRNTILQLAVPDALRGRLSALHIAVVTGGPRLGDAEAGAVAALAGNRVSVVTGGLGCMVGVAVVARLLPEFTRYRAPDG